MGSTYDVVGVEHAANSHAILSVHTQEIRRFRCVRMIKTTVSYFAMPTDYVAQKGAVNTASPGWHSDVDMSRRALLPEESLSPGQIQYTA
jgi:hypothetical protein